MIAYHKLQGSAVADPSENLTGALHSNFGRGGRGYHENWIDARRATTGGGSWGSRPLPFFSKERKCPFSREIRNFRLEMNCFNIDLNTEISGC